MNRCASSVSVVVSLLVAGCLAPGPRESYPPAPPGGECRSCHERAAEEFAATAMARAASRETFRAEWRAQGSPKKCLACHAPGGGEGVACIDCHGDGGHPYPAVAVPRRCARCHDAPGENTVRTFRQSPANRRGRDCVSCHADVGGERFSHRFNGPSDPAFLRGVAQIRAALRRAGSGWQAVVRIRHRAGHALPGGTTGRAVWLSAQGVDTEDRVIWREAWRFGWEHDGWGGWRDRTLPPGEATLVAMSDVARSGTARIRFRLVYHPSAGATTPDAEDAVELDSLTVTLAR